MAEKTPAARVAERPLSPHLQIYSPLINMVMSILHRLTGVALYFGTLLLAAWLIALASGPAAYNHLMGLLATLPGRLVLLGYTWALLHHAIGGIRHLIWDTGRGFSVPTVNALSWLTIVASLSLTGAIWAVGPKLVGSP